ncbi:MAG TPA: hypothetical protein VF571_15250 [Pyrinomonadaceae bacterium]|jgi:hypothetical protein
MSRKENKSVSCFFRKWEVDDERNSHLPIPQTVEQKRVEHEMTEIAEKTSRQLGISRRQGSRC